MSEVGTYPNAATLTGTERILADQGGTPNVPSATGTTVNLTPAQLAAYVGSAIGATLGQKSLSLNTTFSQGIANATQIANYEFGASATPGPGITTITNLTDLTNHFNPFEDFTELTSINSEIERYQPFNSTNHVFNSANLTLQANNPNNDWQCTAITQCAGFTAGVATPIASLGLANTSAILVGQMCAVQGGGNVGGNYWVTAIVTNVSVTLATLNGSTGSQVSTGLIFWLPVYGATMSSPTNVGTNTLIFSSVPATWAIGQAVGWYNHPLGGVTLNRDEEYLITNITISGSTTVTFSPALGNVGNLGTGTIVWALPVIRSGQIWSKMQLDWTDPQMFFAIQADITLFNSVATRTATALNGEMTLANFNAIPNTTPLGAWPAVWAYSADNGNSASLTGSSSEDDFVEIQYGCTQDCAYLNTGAVSPINTQIFVKSDSGWSSFAAFGIAIAPSGTTFSGRNLFQQIITNGIAYRYFNGILYEAREFVWNNQRPTQFSVGLACGGLTAPLTANTIFPNNPAGFANMQVAINSIKIWYQFPGSSIFPPPTP